MARTVRGIEEVAAAEIRALGRVERIGHREVLFHADVSGLDLRCADDVFAVAAEIEGVGHTRAALDVLTRAVRSVDLAPLLAGRDVSTMDVSASFLGRRTYNRYDLEDAVGQPLAARTGLRYVSRRGGAVPPPGLSWRLTVTDDRALLALRLASRPLHRRPWRRVTRPGSLHPPLAAAMLRLAGPLAGRRLLDPCCGVGTIPLEAGDLSIVATDHAPAAVAAARANGLTPVAVADAGRLPLDRGAVDVVVSNPPWDRQVRATGVLGHSPGRFWSELRRVLGPHGRAVLLLPAGTKPGLTVLSRHPVSLSGRHAEVLVMTP